MSEQVIRVDGRFVRLIPKNQRMAAIAMACPLVTVKAGGDGFYYDATSDMPGAFLARDVTKAPHQSTVDID